MDAKDILALVNAGFTKEDILALGNVQEQTPAVPAEVPAPVPAPAPVPVLEVAEVAEPVPAPAPAPVPTPVPAPAVEQPSASDIMREIAKLTSAVQANAIAQSSIPQGTGFNMEDVMANIIKPTRGAK